LGFLKIPLDESLLTVRGLGATGCSGSSPGSLKLTLRFFFDGPAREDRFRADSGLEFPSEETLEPVDWLNLLVEGLDSRGLFRTGLWLFLLASGFWYGA
jgi:hypothetical protein